MVGGDTWAAPLASPGTTGAGSALCYCSSVTPSGKALGDYIIAFQGGLNNTVWLYSVTGNSWTTLSSPGLGEDDGASLVWTGGDYVYSIYGKTKNFRRYTISTATWTNMKNTNGTPNNGASLAWDHGNRIYAINGSNNTAERYAIATTGGDTADTWTNIANVPGNINSGGSLVYPYSTYSASNPLYASRGANSVSFYKYIPLSNAWSVMSNVPSAVGPGGYLCSMPALGYIYCIPGNTSTNHWRYNVAFNVWAEQLPVFPATTGGGARMAGHLNAYITSGYMTSEVIDNSGICEGGALVYNGTNIYGFAGDQSTAFRVYNIAANSWSSLASIQDGTGWGAGLCSNMSTYIYALVGNNTSEFLRYTTASNTWTAMASTPGAVNAGGALVYVATGTGYIYAYQGGNTTFWKYDVAANTWSTVAATSIATAAGASLVYDGTYIYGTIGASTALRLYNIGSNSWSDLTPRADAVQAGGGLAYPGSGNYLYCLEGGNSADLYRYDKVGNTWSQLSSTPLTVFQGGYLISGDSNHLYTCRGFDDVSYWRYTITTDLWESMANTPVYQYLRFDAVVWDRTLPAGTSITYYMRSSNTAFTFSDTSLSWGSALTVTDVNSGASSAVLSGLTAARYVQFKTVYTTSYITSTPLLSKRSLYFYRWF